MARWGIFFGQVQEQYRLFFFAKNHILGSEEIKIKFVVVLPRTSMQILRSWNTLFHMRHLTELLHLSIQFKCPISLVSFSGVQETEHFERSYLCMPFRVALSQMCVFWALSTWVFNQRGIYEGAKTCVFGAFCAHFASFCL